MTEEKDEAVSRRVQIESWIVGHPVYFILIVAAVILFVAMIGFPELFPDWVGIRRIDKPDNVQLEKTLWDWLDLFIVSLVVALALFWLNTSQKRREDKREAEREEKEKERQIDNQHQATVLDYYDKMSELILGKTLGDIVTNWDKNNPPEAPVIVVARTLTLSAFRNLDPSRNASVLRFLGDAGLADKILRGTDTQGVDFSNSDLKLANLAGAYLHEANMRGAMLRKANLRGADLSEAILIGADLIGAILFKASLFRADLSSAKLSSANLNKANLVMANLSGANLHWANLSGAGLIGADLSEANLSEATYTIFTTWPKDFDPKKAGAILVDVEEPY